MTNDDRIEGEKEKCYKCGKHTTKLILWTTEYIDPGRSIKVYKYRCEDCQADDWVG